MAEQGELLANKPDILSSFPGTHRVEGENRLPQVWFSAPHMCCGIYTHVYVHARVHTHMVNQCKIQRKAKVPPISHRSERQVPVKCLVGLFSSKPSHVSSVPAESHRTHSQHSHKASRGRRWEGLPRLRLPWKSHSFKHRGMNTPRSVCVFSKHQKCLCNTHMQALWQC